MFYGKPCEVFMHPQGAVRHTSLGNKSVTEIPRSCDRALATIPVWLWQNRISNCHIGRSLRNQLRQSTYRNTALSKMDSYKKVRGKEVLMAQMITHLFLSFDSKLTNKLLWTNGYQQPSLTDVHLYIDCVYASQIFQWT